MIDDESLITRGRKFDQVLDGAQKVFMRDGFEGASVDEIAREGGVSKATLYSYFPDKRLMFIAVFRAELGRKYLDGIGITDPGRSPAEVLGIIAGLVSDHLASAFGANTYRIAVSEAERFPDLSREYYALGPAAIRETLISHLRPWQAQGMIREDIADLSLAADCFLQLCGADILDRALFMGGEGVDPAAVRRTAANAVEVFLRAYGTAAATAPAGGGC